VVDRRTDERSAKRWGQGKKKRRRKKKNMKNRYYTSTWIALAI